MMDETDISDIVSASRGLVDDIEKLRCYWESKTHWHVRKSFLLHNWDNFKDKDRLICLSQAWVNVHFSGNRYPQEVMDTLKDLEEGLELPDKMIRDAELQVIGIVDDTPKVKNVHDISKLPHTVFPMRFVKPNTSKTLDDNVSDKKDEQCFTKISDKESNKRNFDDKADKTEKDSSSKQIKLIETNELSNVQLSIDMGNHPVDTTPSTTCKIPELPPDATCKKIILNFHERKRLENFVLRQRENESPLSVIGSSAAFSRISEEYSFEQHYIDENTISYSCSLYLDGVLVGKALANQKKSAKYAAAFSALELLRTTQPTIMMSQPGDLESALSRDDITARTGSTDEQKISENNLGNQLLRKMGWKGQGGLGKTGAGISAPVTVNQTYGRCGLGVEKSEDNFISFKEAESVIRNYMSSSSTDQLTFSPELTKTERAKIHKLARKYDLRSKSYNKDDVRFLVLSKKMSAAAMVNELKMSGGNIKGAQLIGPGQVKMGEK